MPLPLGPYDALLHERDEGYFTAEPHERTVRMVSRVSESDKNLLMTVIPDRGLHNLLIQHALKRTADFIRANKLDYTTNDGASRLLDYITKAYDPVREHAVTRSTGKTNARDVGGRAKTVREPSTDITNLPTVIRKVDKGTKRKDEEGGSKEG